MWQIMEVCSPSISEPMPKNKQKRVIKTVMKQKQMGFCQCFTEYWILSFKLNVCIYMFTVDFGWGGKMNADDLQQTSTFKAGGMCRFCLNISRKKTW